MYQKGVQKCQFLTKNTCKILTNVPKRHGVGLKIIPRLSLFVMQVQMTSNFDNGPKIMRQKPGMPSFKVFENPH